MIPRRQTFTRLHFSTFHPIGNDIFRQLPPAPRVEVPSYHVVDGAGRPAGAINRHPFCMSRVFYDAAERPAERWTELADGSCRWRQTAAEVKVQALRVRQPHECLGLWPTQQLQLSQGTLCRAKAKHAHDEHFMRTPRLQKLGLFEVT